MKNEYGCTCVCWGIINDRNKVISLDCDTCYYTVRMITDIMNPLPKYCPSCGTKINWGNDLEGHFTKTGDDNHPLRVVAEHNHKLQFKDVIFPKLEFNE